MSADFSLSSPAWFSYRRILLWGIALLLCLNSLPITLALAAEDATSAAQHSIPSEVVAGQTLTFTFTYTHDHAWGTISAINLVDKIPDGTTFVSGGTFNDTTREVTVAHGPLAKGARPPSPIRCRCQKTWWERH